MEKNWKKIIARRHARAETDERPPQPPGGESPVKSASGGGDAAKQPERKPKQEKKPDSETVGIAKRQLEVRVCRVCSGEGGGIELKRRVLSRAQELEAKLQLLVDEKHAKFLQLKTILVQEARSKSSSSSNSSSTPAPASVALGSAGQASKKRRVDAKDVAVGSATSPHSALNELSAADSPRTAAAEPASSSLS
ncbi:hypothetical protein PybrP1_003560 [[Pythium] brassicae (nom. inval.)]|nr:hypothetical protein PybrP1_003560 [[Pythium] brassicae (nom. inval.)]